MKEVKRYKCDYCRTEYDKKSDAEKCEHAHKMPESFNNAKFLPIDREPSGYPITVNITFKNGETIRYVRG